MTTTTTPSLLLEQHRAAVAFHDLCKAITAMFEITETRESMREPDEDSERRLRVALEDAATMKALLRDIVEGFVAKRGELYDAQDVVDRLVDVLGRTDLIERFLAGDRSFVHA